MIDDIKCPYCNSIAGVKFPCCGYLCMRCGKNYDEVDLENAQKGNKKEIEDVNGSRNI